ncbi:unnamed protein product, partial [Closterium sp. NIES-54]
MLSHGASLSLYACSPFPVQLAKLDQEDMRTVINLEFLGVGINKDASSGFSLSFGSRKV